MCAVACGGADAYWECGMHIWDMAAASIIVSSTHPPFIGENSDQTYILNLIWSTRNAIICSPASVRTVLVHPTPRSPHPSLPSVFTQLNSGPLVSS